MFATSRAARSSMLPAPLDATASGAERGGCASPADARPAARGGFAESELALRAGVVVVDPHAVRRHTALLGDGGECLHLLHSAGNEHVHALEVGIALAPRHSILRSAVGSSDISSRPTLTGRCVEVPLCVELSQELRQDSRREPAWALRRSALCNRERQRRPFRRNRLGVEPATRKESREVALGVPLVERLQRDASPRG